jgi:hypothetical protein
VFWCGVWENSLSAIVELCRGLEGLAGAAGGRIEGREDYRFAALLISQGWPKQVRHLACGKGAVRLRIIVGIP